MIRRREFITLIGGAAAVWPHMVYGQPAERVRRVAIFMAYAEDDIETKHRIAEFRRALEGFGWSEGRNIQFDFRNAGADPALRRSYAVELVNLAPDVILASTVPVTATLKATTATIPVVFAGGGDPVAAGLVASLARPDGNITGFSVTEPSLAGKWFELLREIAPDTRRIAILHAPENPVRAQYLRALGTANAALKLDLTEFDVQSGEQIERVIDSFARTSNMALLVLPGASTSVHRNAIIEAAARNRLPAIYPFQYFAASGGLLSYGADNGDLFRRAAAYVDRILRGEKPANLPIQVPTKFELVISLKTAKTLGLTIPPTLLARADEVIE